jgi:acyl carrier protein
MAAALRSTNDGDGERSGPVHGREPTAVAGRAVPPVGRVQFALPLLTFPPGGGLMDPRQHIRNFILETFFVSDFDDRASFLRTGIIDSMGMAQLVTFLEQTFGISVADGELVPDNLDSLERVVAFVERKRASAA